MPTHQAYCSIAVSFENSILDEFGQANFELISIKVLT